MKRIITARLSIKLNYNTTKLMQNLDGFWSYSKSCFFATAFILSFILLLQLVTRMMIDHVHSLGEASANLSSSFLEKNLMVNPISSAKSPLQRLGFSFLWIYSLRRSWLLSLCCMCLQNYYINGLIIMYWGISLIRGAANLLRLDTCRWFITSLCFSFIRSLIECLAIIIAASTFLATTEYLAISSKQYFLH